MHTAEGAVGTGPGAGLSEWLPPFYLWNGTGGGPVFCRGCVALRACFPQVTLEGARPCESQADRWPREERLRYQAILDQCDYETLVQHHYDRGCMARRNRYMVDRACRIIAVYDGEPRGGTAQTLAYAMRQGLELDILEI